MRWLSSHPILSCAAAGALELRVLERDEGREWNALVRAGRGIAAGIRRDLAVAGSSLTDARMLVLAGKGHNGADALLAASTLLAEIPGLSVDVGFVHGTSALRPLTARAWRELVHFSGNRVRNTGKDTLAAAYTVVLDGVYGFQFRPPLDAPAAAWIAATSGVVADLRAAVDLPSGLDAPGAFVADVTYATGTVKAPLLTLPNAGRVRWIDLGFLRGDEPGDERVIAPQVLQPLRKLRPAQSDKRTFGHLFVVGGSGSFPGAVLMTVQAALRSGAGLVTAFVPERLAPAYAAAWPEAMWHGCPETSEGGLALDTAHAIRSRWSQANAVVVGPGMAREPETLALATTLLRESTIPVVVDADALQAQVVWSGSCPRILTPHAGEFARISNGAGFREFRPAPRAVTVLKGPVTRIADGTGTVYHSFAGGPVLARGGSGDILAGLIGGLLSQQPAQLLDAAVRGVAWHGAAADRLAELKGEVAVRTTEVLDYLGAAIRAG